MNEFSKEKINLNNYLSNIYELFGALIQTGKRCTELCTFDMRFIEDFGGVGKEKTV